MKLKLIDTRLIFLEGIPGSGKSTTAQRLYLHLLGHGHEARWFYEFDETHPILRAKERHQLLERGTTDTGGIREQFLARWRAMAGSQSDDCGVTIFDGALFQVPIGLLLLMNDDPQQIVRHLVDVGATVAPLSPLLVYFYQDDIARAIAAVCEQRQDDSFADGLVELIAQTPYGKLNQTQDLGGVVTFFEHKHEITESVLQQLEISKLAIETSAGDWVQYEQQITQSLSLTEIAPFAEVEDPDQYVGRYRSAGESNDLSVTLGPRGVCVDGHDQKRLIHKQDRTFFLEASCLELRFEEDEHGAIRRFHLNGPLEIPESEWTKVT